MDVVLEKTYKQTFPSYNNENVHDPLKLLYITFYNLQSFHSSVKKQNNLFSPLQGLSHFTLSISLDIFANWMQLLEHGTHDTSAVS